ncbi:hypothetical protein LSTR_LSTR015051 [Laodelphax striatellus]|uniref:CCDC174 alpha/beta GRSR domain-containing protein n=1 Tax=Laodelphax striatellus TaxID=195883 RepID=A0A482X4S0_LAOST|nr:hypothetical protein LSTR_LSTR015051 [Laodelphax striatellus]
MDCCLHRVDYTDIVGRQRRCLRRDLDAMRARDADSLLPPPPSPPPPPVVGFEVDAAAAQRMKREAPAAAPPPPHIEAMRRQWRIQEEKLLEKNNVHYEDLLFNEARTHGVGYYAFSTDETERARQMLELERRRAETLRHQGDAEGLRARRDAQLKARLQAAKARNRQRMGLPPLAPGEQQEQSKDDVVLVEKPEEKTDDETSKKDGLEAALKRAAHIRPWDAEKLGLKIVGGADQPAVMSQSEWVDMKREERISEFAPPEMYNQSRAGATIQPQTIDLSASEPSENKTLFFTSKRPKAADFFKNQQPLTSTEPHQSQGHSKNQYRTAEQSREQYRCDEQSRNLYRTHENLKSVSQCSNRLIVDDDEEPVKRKRTEIPPPLTAEYFGGTGKPIHKPLTKSSGVGESISEGIKYLNEQKKVKDNKRDKGLLDII